MPDDPIDIDIKPGGCLWVTAEVCACVLVVAFTWMALAWLAGAR
jgi:hypothetical protein